MTPLAGFTPIINDLGKRAQNYYSQNKAQIPDNDYFKDFFNLGDLYTDSKEKEIVSSQNDFHAPTFFKQTPKYKPEGILDITNKSKNDNWNIRNTLKGSIADRHNNPGNLMFVNQEGAVKGEPRGKGHWAKFKSPKDGFKALIADLKAKQTGKTRTGLTGESTLYDLMSIYAPPTENDTNKYVDNLSKKLGATKDTRIKDINTEQLAKQIAFLESSTIID